jgi:type II secretion system protein G
MPLPIFNIKSFKIDLKFKTSNLKFAQAFTLIELLVVISIIAILMAVATVSYLNAQQKGRDNKRKTDLKAIQQALEIYYTQNGKYPSGSTGSIQCNTGITPLNDSSVLTWGASTIFSCDPDGSGPKPTITYMSPLPKEPIFTAASDTYFYSSPTTDTYILSAKLENLNDKDIAAFALPCTAPASRNYCVINP